MIEFNAITYFLQRIAALKAVRRGVYATVPLYYTLYTLAQRPNL